MVSQFQKTNAGSRKASSRSSTGDPPRSIADRPERPFTPSQATITSDTSQAGSNPVTGAPADRYPGSQGNAAPPASGAPEGFREEANQAAVSATDAAFAATDAVRDASAQIADVAKEALRATADAVSSQAAELAASVKDELTATAEVQKERGADAMHRLANAARTAAQELDGNSPQIARQIRAAASSVDSLSNNIHGKSVGELFSAATDFARSQPAAFFAGAVIAGFAFSRFLKSSSAPASQPDSGGASKPSTMTSSPGVAPSAPPMATF